MRKLPVRISPCPIEDAVIEIRFVPKVPEEAVFGIVFNSVAGIFGQSSTERLPISQIPEQIRNNDPNLKYQSHYRLRKDYFGISVGPRSVVISNSNKYQGWISFSEIVYQVVDSISIPSLMKNVERVGLRYINVFRTDLLSKINVNLDVNGKAITDEVTNIRTEIRDIGMLTVLQIGNMVGIKSNGANFTGSVIDIDCITNMNEPIDSFKTKYKDIIERSHDAEKKQFFGLLNDEFLKLFHPEYEG